MTIAANPRRALGQRHDSGYPREPGSRGGPSAAATLGGEPDWLACGHLLRPADEADLLAHLGWCRERATTLAASPLVRGLGLATTCRTIAARLGEAARLLTGEGD